jgi:hypothetical protein
MLLLVAPAAFIHSIVTKRARETSVWYFSTTHKDPKRGRALDVKPMAKT